MLVLAALLGLALGHVLDLTFDRLYAGEPWVGPLYRCPSCRERLRPPFLLPVLGYLWSGGRCLRCRAPIPWRAIALPLGGATLFLLAALAYDDLGPTLLAGLFATIFLALALTDIERGLIPNRLVYPAMLMAAAFAWAWPDRDVSSVFAGGAAAFALMLALYILGRGALGFGDVKLAALLGLVAGLGAAIVGLLLGAIVAGALVALLLVLRLLRRGQFIPYGPFIALGAIVATLWGGSIVDWYWG